MTRPRAVPSVPCCGGGLLEVFIVYGGFVPVLRLRCGLHAADCDSGVILDFIIDYCGLMPVLCLRYDLQGAYVPFRN